MTKAGWKSVTDESPCRICGKPDWCSVSTDGHREICRRVDNGSGIRKVDRSGADYWVYKRGGRATEHVGEKMSSDGHQEPDRTGSDTLHTVYTALLDDLTMSAAHRQHLNRRSLSEREIKKRGYCTLPAGDRKEIARRLVDHFDAEVCSRVPGLYRKEDGSWSLAGAAGIVVPVRDDEGRIVALKVRADDGGSGPKYSYLSSTAHGGPGPGAQVHVPLTDGLDQDDVRLTEGELKADVATVLSGTLSISIAGVASWRQALPVLRKLGASTVYLALDADARTNPTVARALSEAFKTLEERGFQVVLETWSSELGKGIDDLLVAGHTSECKEGAAARAEIRRIGAEANGISLVPKNIINAAELLATEFPEPTWIIPDTVPEGVTILGGKPKMGKSWLALDVGVAVASGGVALGDVQVERGSVLYLALEDNQRRLQKRLRKLLSGRTPPQGLELATEYPRLDEGGLEALEVWLDDHSDARLVIVDTFEKFRKKRSGQNLYADDYGAVEPLMELAARYNVAIVVVHHLRKNAADDPLEQISGSMGLTGGVDGVMVLNRERGRADAYLYVTGRDIEEEKELALTWDNTTATWTIAGEAEEYKLSKERQEIIDCLRSIGEPAGPKEVGEILGKRVNNVKQLLWQMSNDGEIRTADRGKYIPLVDNLDNPNNFDEAVPEESVGIAETDEIEEVDDSVDQEVIEVSEVSNPTANFAGHLLVTSEEQLEGIMDKIRTAENLAVDLETTGLNPRKDMIRLISISTTEDTWLIDCFKVNPSPLFPLLADKKLVMHNGQFDLGFLFAMGFEFEEGGEVVDTMLMSQILEDKEAA